MLEAMSKILVFTMEEKESLGMVKKEVLEGQTEDKTGLIKKGFSEKLINFLLDDEEEE